MSRLRAITAPFPAGGGMGWGLAANLDPTPALPLKGREVRHTALNQRPRPTE